MIGGYGALDEGALDIKVSKHPRNGCLYQPRSRFVMRAPRFKPRSRERSVFRS